jgi:hypothetical protein
LVFRFFGADFLACDANETATDPRAHSTSASASSITSAGTW